MANLLKPIVGARSKALASLLITHFGSILKIMNASPEALNSVLSGERHVTDALLAVRELATLSWQDSLATEPVSVGDRRLGGFFYQKLGQVREERLHAIFLDDRSRFIRDECVGTGSRSSLGLRTRSLVKRSLELEANKIIIAHNHPSGCFRPSKSDQHATAEFEEIARKIDIELTDHCIVAGNFVYSMRVGKLL